MPYSVRVGAAVQALRLCYRWPGGGPIRAAPTGHRAGRRPTAIAARTK
jgi:hypothetical protein